MLTFIIESTIYTTVAYTVFHGSIWIHDNIYPILTFGVPL